MSDIGMEKLVAELHFRDVDMMVSDGFFFFLIVLFFQIFNFFFLAILGIFRWPTLDCIDGYCSPINPNIEDACIYICGRNPCKDLHLG